MIDYTKYPKANTPYIAYKVSWENLSEQDKNQAKTQFSATKLMNKSFDDYFYIVGSNGGMIARRIKNE